jgi:hypothetical protein
VQPSQSITTTYQILNNANNQDSRDHYIAPHAKNIYAENCSLNQIANSCKSENLQNAYSPNAILRISGDKTKTVEEVITKYQTAKTL